MSSYDPDESTQPQNYSTTEPQSYNQLQQPQNTQNRQGPIAPPTLGSQRKMAAQKVATISQNYNEKSMLLSSDEEYQ